MEIISPVADTPNNEPKYPKGLLSLFVEPTSICPMIAAPIKPINIKTVGYLDAENNSENEALGSRKVAFTRELYIEADDFMEEPPKKYYRFFVGNEVRLRNAYFVKCTDVIKDENGNIVEIYGIYDEETS